MSVSIVLSECNITDTSRKFITWQESEFSTTTFAFSNVYLIAGCKLLKQIEKLLKSRCFGKIIKRSSIYLLKNSLINKYSSLEKYFGNSCVNSLVSSW